VDAAAAAAGLGPSTWLKDLVRREVGELSVDQAPVVERGAERGDPVYRAALDADLVAKLDERVKSDGLRDRAAGLRALIEGAVVLPQSGDVSLRDAVQVLAQSNENLAALWLSVTKEAHTIAGSASSGDRRALRTAAAEIRRHIDVAVQLVGQLRPLLKRPAR
jgi:HPt (histidine-containing phosphotransfer) domain-containing protein